MRAASPEDVDAVRALLAEAAAWTTSIGFPNWPASFSNKFVSRGVSDGTLFVAVADGETVATMTLQWSDESVWGAGAGSDDAGYVHRLVVRRDRAGAGLGAALLDWAAGQVRANDRAWLRLDASADNLPLCSYYEHNGFEYQGDVEGEYTEPDGRVRRWKSRRYERAAAEEKGK